MGKVRFRKSVRIAPGIRVNFSSKGVGYSVGGKGFRVSQRADGRVTRTIGIPGTGFSQTETIGNTRKRTSTPQSMRQPAQFANQATSPSGGQKVLAFVLNIIFPGVGFLSIRQYGAAFFWLLMYGMAILGVHQLIGSMILCSAIHLGLTIAARANSETALHESTEATQGLTAQPPRAAPSSPPRRPEYMFNTTSHGDEKSALLQSLFQTLQEAQRCWLVLSETQTHNLKAAAGIEIDRMPVDLTLLTHLDVSSPYPVPEMNAHGRFRRLLWTPEQLVFAKTILYPKVVHNVLGATAQLETRRFLETDTPPSDATQAGETWLYLNKNGTPDRRYSENRVVPIMLYETITIKLADEAKTTLGIQVSSPTVAKKAFAILCEFLGQKDEQSSQPNSTQEAPPQSAYSPYSTLGVSEDASPLEISDAYRELVKKYHPDRVASLGEEFRLLAEEKMKVINAAYAEIQKERDL